MAGWLAAVAAVPFPPSDHSLHGDDQAVHELAMSIKREAANFEGQANRTLLRPSQITCNSCEPSEEQLHQRARTIESEAKQAAQLPRNKILKQASLHCAGNPSSLAALIAMDIRLPDGTAHCDDPGDLSCDSLEDVVNLINAITDGSDVLVATDREFDADVKTHFKNVVATRYSDDPHGGHPIDEVDNKHFYQWWRLREAWILMEDYEHACKHTYSWVFKLRTDLAIQPTNLRLVDLFAGHAPKVNLQEGMPIDSDRWFGGSRSQVAHLAKMQTEYENGPGDHSVFRGVYGSSGGCELLGTTFVNFDVCSGLNEYSLPDNESLPYSHCIDTAYGRSLCLLHEYDKDRLLAIAGVAQTVVGMPAGALYERYHDPVPTAAPKGKHFCTIAHVENRVPDFTVSESSFALHALKGMIRAQKWADSPLLEGMINSDKGGLRDWRKMLHLWKHGISIEDGPVMPATEPKVALAMARLQLMNDAAALPHLRDLFSGPDHDEKEEPEKPQIYVRRHA